MRQVNRVDLSVDLHLCLLEAYHSVSLSDFAAALGRGLRLLDDAGWPRYLPPNRAKSEIVLASHIVNFFERLATWSAYRNNPNITMVNFLEYLHNTFLTHSIIYIRASNGDKYRLKSVDETEYKWDRQSRFENYNQAHHVDKVRRTLVSRYAGFEKNFGIFLGLGDKFAWTGPFASGTVLADSAAWVSCPDKNQLQAVLQHLASEWSGFPNRGLLTFLYNTSHRLAKAAANDDAGSIDLFESLQRLRQALEPELRVFFGDRDPS